MNLDSIKFDPPSEGWEPIATGNFMTMVGPLWRRRVNDGYEHGLLAQTKHANHRNAVFGGVIMAFAEYAVGHVMGDPYETVANVQFDLQFLAAAQLGDFLIGRGEIMRRSSSLIFTRGTVESAGKTVASAHGIWKIVRPNAAM